MPVSGSKFVKILNNNILILFTIQIWKCDCIFISPVLMMELCLLHRVCGLMCNCLWFYFIILVIITIIISFSNSSLCENSIRFALAFRRISTYYNHTVPVSLNSVGLVSSSYTPYYQLYAWTLNPRAPNTHHIPTTPSIVILIDQMDIWVVYVAGMFV